MFLSPAATSKENRGLERPRKRGSWLCRVLGGPWKGTLPSSPHSSWPATHAESPGPVEESFVQLLNCFKEQTNKNEFYTAALETQLGHFF